MSVSQEQILHCLNEIAPLSGQASWDNSGLQLNLGERLLHKLLVCLDLTEAVVDEARVVGADFIVCHHPMLMEGILSLDGETPLGRRFLVLIREGIGVYAAHTSFDFAPGGNNDWLAQRLGLEAVEVLLAPDGSGAPMGVQGGLPEALSLEGLAVQVEERLALQHPVRLVGRREQPVRRLAICSGSGSSAIPAAAVAGCQALLTGDVSHHKAQQALEAGICLLDAGHHGTERCFVENMAGQLEAALEGAVEIVRSQVNTDPFCS